MARTVLIGGPETTWHEWIKDHRPDRDFLNLDPADPAQEPPGRFTLMKGSRLAAWHFYGSLDPNRAPHVLLAALVNLLQFAEAELVIQLPAYSPSPLLRQTIHLALQLSQPDEILIAKGSALEGERFATVAESVELPEALLPTVQAAQRKAHWLRMLEQCEEHQVDLDKVQLSGARLGSGRRLTRPELTNAGLKEVQYAESCGPVLYLVSKLEPDGEHLGRALNIFGAQRASVILPSAVEGLLCAFARQSGEDFGMGLIQSINFETRKVYALTTAIAPAPVKTIRLGSLKIDTAGRELGEIRPWEI